MQYDDTKKDNHNVITTHIDIDDEDDDDENDRRCSYTIQRTPQSKGVSATQTATLE